MLLPYHLKCLWGLPGVCRFRYCQTFKLYVCGSSLLLFINLRDVWKNHLCIANMIYIIILLIAETAGSFRPVFNRQVDIGFNLVYITRRQIKLMKLKLQWTMLRSFCFADCILSKTNFLIALSWMRIHMVYILYTRITLSESIKTFFFSDCKNNNKK